MKWKPQMTVKEMPKSVPEVPVPIPSFPAVQSFFLECIGCANKAAMMFEGSSYCRGCLKHKFRTGQLGRFYEHE